MNGIHEVRGSIPLVSTIKIDRRVSDKAASFSISVQPESLYQNCGSVSLNCR